MGVISQIIQMCSKQATSGSRIYLIQPMHNPEADTHCQCTVDGHGILIYMKTDITIYTILASSQKEYVITAVDSTDTTSVHNTLFINSTTSDVVDILMHQRLPESSPSTQFKLDITSDRNADSLTIKCFEASAEEAESVYEKPGALWLALVARPVVIAVAAVFTFGILILILVTIAVVVVATRRKTPYRNSTVVMRAQAFKQRISTLYDVVVGYRKRKSRGNPEPRRIAEAIVERDEPDALSVGTCIYSTPEMSRVNLNVAENESNPGTAKGGGYMNMGGDMVDPSKGYMNSTIFTKT
ncbi:hypothetical protein ScPMuIL_011931 [Solemya velum]